MNRIALILPTFVCLLALSTVHASAAFVQTIDDSNATFSSWNGNLQTAIDPTAVGGSYHYINSWADSGNDSAVVRYQLSGVPAGNNLYHISFSSPNNPTFGTGAGIVQWHIFDVAADGTENFAQDIPWAGQFGTNKQWLGPNSGYNPGGYTTLGPGPQNDGSLEDGRTVWLNGSGSGDPYIYIKFQGFYTGPIAFDAITVTQVPEPSTIVLSLVGSAGIGLAVWRRRRSPRG